MKFKPPRDPNTDPCLIKIRDVKPEEGIVCQVGSGECLELAVESQDNGDGGEFFLCRQHSKEFREFAVLVAEMTPKQLDDLESAIIVAELSP